MLHAWGGANEHVGVHTAVEECSLDVRLEELEPQARGDRAQHTDRLRANIGGERLEVMDPIALGEAADDQAGLSAYFGRGLERKHPLRSAWVSAWGKFYSN